MNIESLIREKTNIQINTAPGLNTFLEQELLELGYTCHKTANTGVSLVGTLNDCINLNLKLRTAHRVLIELKSAVINNANELYKMAYDIPWENLMEVNGYVAVDSFVKNDTMLDNRFANVRIKDAVADRFVKLCGKRPDSGPTFLDTVVFLFWNKSQAIIYLDTTGPSLSKHGYRRHTTEAPLQESLACAIIMASTWDKNSSFVSPMCGSGTLAIEAAWMAQGVSPGMNREHFAFQKIKGYSPAYFNEQLLKLNAQVKSSLPFRIIASDIDETALKAAEENAKIAGVEDLIDFTLSDFKDTILPENKGAIVMNPPYGERLGKKDELIELYTEIGAFFKRSPGWIGMVLSGDKELDKWIKLKPAQKTPCLNGKLECKMLRFELYEGSRRIPRDN